MSKNISCVTEVDMCCACGACISVCKKKCINLKQTSIGRLYATIDSNCIDCGLCMKVCPSLNIPGRNDDFFSLDKLNILVARAQNEKVLMNAQSGGAVTTVLTMLFRTKKIDAALVVDAQECVPLVVTEESQLYASQKSVYTPLPLLIDIDKIMHYKSVAIVGLPCHLTGIVNMKKYKSIPIKYKIGLICDRNLCSTIKTGILKYFGLTINDNVIVKWRDKNAGEGYNYKNAPISVWYNNRQIGVIESKVRQKLKQAFTPLRCRCCPDKLNLNADLVFGDPWNIDTADDNGSSLIIANTSIGQDILKQSIEKGYLSVSHICTGKELNESQHILERRKQVSLYSRILNKHNTTCFVLNQHNKDRKITKEYLRALFSVMYFKFLEMQPQFFIECLVKRVITRLNKK